MQDVPEQKKKAVLVLFMGPGAAVDRDIPPAAMVAAAAQAAMVPVAVNVAA